VKYFLKICAVLCAAAGLLMMAGCLNQILPQPQPETGLRVTINGSAGERTLYPSADPVFSKYTLEITNDSETKGYTIENNENSIIITDLTSGEWNIKATGFMMITGTEYVVAEGTEDIVVPTDGKFGEVEITISSKPIIENGPAGTFSLNVTYPDSVNNVELFIYHVGDNYSRSIYQWNSQDSEQSSVNWYISSGYYMMTLLLRVHSNGLLYRTAAWTEVIHIYSGLETKAEKTFTDDDLTRFFTLSGAVNVTVDGTPADFTNILVYRNQNRNEDELLGDYPVLDGNWELSFPAFNQPTNLYIFVEARYRGNVFSGWLDPVPVQAADVTRPITKNFGKAVLSGTAAIKVDTTETPSESLIEVRDSAGNQLGRSEIVSGNWEISLDEQYIGTEVFLWVYATDKQKYSIFYNTGTSLTLSETNAAITLNPNIIPIKVTGTVGDITVNGYAPNFATVEILQDARWVGGGSVITPNSTWEMWLSPDLENANVRFYVEGSDFEDESFSINTGVDKILSNSPSVAFDALATVNRIKFSGTANIKVNGVTPDTDVQIRLYRTGGSYDWTFVDPDYGDWEIVVRGSFPNPVDVNFKVWAQGSADDYDIGVNKELTNSSPNQSVPIVFDIQR